MNSIINNTKVTADISANSPVLPKPQQAYASTEQASVDVLALAPNQAVEAQQQGLVNQEALQPKEEEQQEPSSDEVSQAVEDISQYFQSIERDLFFEVDEDSGRTIITVVDAETEEVVRQIPPKELLNIAKRLDDIKGVLFSAQA